MGGLGRIRETSRRPGKPRVSCRGLQRGEGMGEQAARGEATGGVNRAVREPGGVFTLAKKPILYLYIVPGFPLSNTFIAL